MKIMLALALIVAIASIVGIAVAVNNVVQKGHRAEQANNEAEQARLDLSEAQHELDWARAAEDSKSITVQDPNGKIALWKAQNGY